MRASQSWQLWRTGAMVQVMEALRAPAMASQSSSMGLLLDHAQDRS